MAFDRHGNRVWRDVRELLDAEHARYAISEVAVPYGRCTEPSNVRAGGGACPIRFRCAGCDHFRTDVSYLPDLTAYLDDLLRTRERLAAAIDGVDDWARADATPAQEEITRIRRLISRIKGDLAELSDTENTAIDDAVAAVRKHRAVTLGMPARRPGVCRGHRDAGHRMTRQDKHHRIRRAGSGAPRRADARRTASRLGPPPSARHRRARPRRRARRGDQRVRHRPRSRVDRTFLYRHRDLLAQVHALETAPPATSGTGPAVSRASLQADLLAAQERAIRMAARVRQLEHRLSSALGEQAWQESGLGAPADIDALKQQATQLEQQLIDLRLQLEERDQDLAAARAANRELMAQLNATTRHR